MDALNSDGDGDAKTLWIYVEHWIGIGTTNGSNAPVKPTMGHFSMPMQQPTTTTSFVLRSKRMRC